MKQSGNKTEQKTVNRARVLNLILSHPGISRIRIAKDLGFDRSTITTIVSPLMKSGLVLELEPGASSGRGGRRPVGLKINPGFGLVLGLEIQVTRFRYVFLDLEGKIRLAKSGIPEGRDFFDRLKRISNLVKKDMRRIGLTILRGGIGMPGHIDTASGTVISSLPLGLQGRNVSEPASAMFGFPILADNDANCCAWGEVGFDSKGEGENIIYLMMELHSRTARECYDQEIGVGLVFGGRVYYGTSSSAGELSRLGGDAEAESILALAAAEGKDSAEREGLFRRYFYRLFTRFALLVSVLDPGSVVLGGEFLNHRETIDSVLKEIRESLSATDPFGKCPFRYSRNAEMEAAYGAAFSQIVRLFQVPGTGTGQGMIGLVRAE